MTETPLTPETPAKPKEVDAGSIMAEYQTRGQIPAEIIKAKIAVMGEVGEVGKTGRNNFHNYDYSTDYDVLKAVVPIMTKHGITFEFWPVHAYQDGHGNMNVTFMFEWQHESGVRADPIPWRGISNNIDKNGKQQDKWFNMAATSAQKYFLIKQFNLRVTLDPKEDPDKAEGPMITDAVAAEVTRQMIRGNSPAPVSDNPPALINEPNPDDAGEVLGKAEARDLMKTLEDELKAKSKSAEAVEQWGAKRADEIESLPKEWRDAIYALYRAELAAHKSQDAE